MLMRLISFLIALLMTTACAQATILPAEETDRAILASTGLSCSPAVILCESLSVLDARGDQGGQVVDTLYYSGTETIPVLESWDGWAKICYGAGHQHQGWVNSDYLMFSPAWYVCDAQTQVYAWPDTMAPRVALLEKGTTLPILHETTGEYQQEWVCVSLRAAAGWIRKTPADTVGNTFFRPEMLSSITQARLTLPQGEYVLKSPEALALLSRLLTSVHDTGGETAGCPFGATLTLTLAAGDNITLNLATDSCCVYRVDGRDYQYARYLKTPDNGVDNAVLFSLFGVKLF